MKPTELPSQETALSPPVLEFALLCAIPTTTAVELKSVAATVAVVPDAKHHCKPLKKFNFYEPILKTKESDSMHVQTNRAKKFWGPVKLFI